MKVKAAELGRDHKVLPGTESKLLELAIVAAVIAFYFATRAYGIVDFPPFFFGDEAVQANHAAELISNRGYDREGTFLPTYFVNGSQHNLGTSVYIHAASIVTFGKSVLVVRLTSVAFTCLAVIWMCRTMKFCFGMRHWWLVGFLLASVPAWYLHARTAFETMIAASLFSGVIYYYLLYRGGRFAALLPVAICTALMFYAYNPARMVVLAFALFVLIAEARFLFRHRIATLALITVLLLLALPLLRFTLAHPDAISQSLRLNSSVIVAGKTLAETVSAYLTLYVQSLDPRYWFLGQEVEQIRHVMKGYGHLFWPTIIPFLIGLGICVRRIGDYRYRALILALIAAPTGAAMVGPYITRLMMVIIPYVIIVSLGLDQIIRWLIVAVGRSRVARKVRIAAAIPVSVAVLLAGQTLFMTIDASRNGSTWFSDYSITGYQFGARQVFSRVVEETARTPERDIYVSHIWANGADEVARFFLGDPLPVQMASVGDQISRQELPLSDNPLFFIHSSELPDFLAIPFLEGFQEEGRILRPDGAPGFYLIAARYTVAAPEFFRAASRELEKMVVSEVTIDGRPAIVNHSQFDLGNLEAVFDGNPFSLVRTAVHNPAVLEITFDAPHPITGLLVNLSDRPVNVDVYLADSKGQPVGQFHLTAKQIGDDGVARMSLSRPVEVAKVRLELFDPNQSARGHLHLWEIGFQQ